MNLRNWVSTGLVVGTLLQTSVSSAQDSEHASARGSSAVTVMFGANGRWLAKASPSTDPFEPMIGFHFAGGARFASTWIVDVAGSYSTNPDHGLWTIVPEIRNRAVDTPTFGLWIGAGIGVALVSLQRCPECRADVQRTTTGSTIAARLGMELALSRGLWLGPEVEALLVVFDHAGTRENPKGASSAFAVDLTMRFDVPVY